MFLTDILVGRLCYQGTWLCGIPRQNNVDKILYDILVKQEEDKTAIALILCKVKIAWYDQLIDFKKIYFCNLF